MKEIIPAGAASSGMPLSPAIRWGDLLFVSGIVAADPATRQIVGTTVEEQVTFILDKLGELLAAAGSGYEHVLKVTCFLADGGDFAAWNSTYVNYFPSAAPARTTVVAGFPGPEIKVEVEVIAGIP